VSSSIKAQNPKWDGHTDRIGYLCVVGMPLACLLNVLTVAKVSGLSIRPSDLLFVGATTAWALRIITKLRIQRNQLLPICLLIFFLLIEAVGFLFLGNQVDWAKSFRFVQTMFWGVLALTFLRSEVRFHRLIHNIIITCVIMAGLSIYLYIENPLLQRIVGYVSAAGGQGLGRQASYNEWGALYALIITVLLWRSWHRGLSKIQWLALAVLAVGLLLDQSRSALLALGLCALLLSSTNLKGVFIGRFDKKTVIMTIGFICATLVGAAILNHLSINRISESFAPGSNAQESIQVRLILWRESLIFWTADDSLPRFLLGVGNKSLSNFIQGPTTDSFYLDHGVSHGFLGLLALLTIVVAPGLQAWSAGNFVKEASLGMLVVIICLTVSLTGNVLVDPTYGGISFLLLYGFLSIRTAKKSSS